MTVADQLLALDERRLPFIVETEEPEAGMRPLILSACQNLNRALGIKCRLEPRHEGNHANYLLSLAVDPARCVRYEWRADGVADALGDVSDRGD